MKKRGKKADGYRTVNEKDLLGMLSGYVGADVSGNARPALPGGENPGSGGVK